MRRDASKDSHLVLNNAFEIVGKVNADLSVKVLVATDFGPNLGALLCSAYFCSALRPATPTCLC